ncbi:hypothetical protein Anapl_15818 [Anas platyrhynchos]|uniref:Uncharacterized protein n=1 Tax=Anas platyrhynchos TaxID=8839 RepID=R0KZX5_ANAPL|nr:hypothetical protein Anapl_15818 [Anas platyrhynchos]
MGEHPQGYPGEGDAALFYRLGEKLLGQLHRQLKQKTGVDETLIPSWENRDHRKTGVPQKLGEALSLQSARSQQLAAFSASREGSSSAGLTARPQRHQHLQRERGELREGNEATLLLASDSISGPFVHATCPAPSPRSFGGSNMGAAARGHNGTEVAHHEPRLSCLTGWELLGVQPAPPGKSSPDGLTSAQKTIVAAVQLMIGFVSYPKKKVQLGQVKEHRWEQGACGCSAANPPARRGRGLSCSTKDGELNCSATTALILLISNRQVKLLRAISTGWLSPRALQQPAREPRTGGLSPTLLHPATSTGAASPTPGTCCRAGRELPPRSSRGRCRELASTQAPSAQLGSASAILGGTEPNGNGASSKSPLRTPQGQRQGTAQRGPAKRLQHLQFHGAERAAEAAGGTARCCPWPWRARNIGTPGPTSLFQNGLVPGPPPLLLPGYQHARITTAPSRTPSHQDHHNSFLNTIIPNFPNGSFMLSTSPGVTSIHQTAVVHGRPQHRDKTKGQNVLGSPRRGSGAQEHPENIPTSGTGLEVPGEPSPTWRKLILCREPSICRDRVTPGPFSCSCTYPRFRLLIAAEQEHLFGQHTAKDASGSAKGAQELLHLVSTTEAVQGAAAEPCTRCPTSLAPLEPAGRSSKGADGSHPHLSPTGTLGASSHPRKASSGAPSVDLGTQKHLPRPPPAPTLEGRARGTRGLEGRQTPGQRRPRGGQELSRRQKCSYTHDRKSKFLQPLPEPAGFRSLPGEVRFTQVSGPGITPETQPEQQREGPIHAVPPLLRTHTLQRRALFTRLSRTPIHGIPPLTDRSGVNKTFYAAFHSPGNFLSKLGLKRRQGDEKSPAPGSPFHAAAAQQPQPGFKFSGSDKAKPEELLRELCIKHLVGPSLSSGCCRGRRCQEAVSRRTGEVGCEEPARLRLREEEWTPGQCFEAFRHLEGSSPVSTSNALSPQRRYQKSEGCSVPFTLRLQHQQAGRWIPQSKPVRSPRTSHAMISFIFTFFALTAGDLSANERHEFKFNFEHPFKRLESKQLL